MRRPYGAGRSSSTAPSPTRALADPELLPRAALLELAGRVRRWHEAQRPADLTLEVEPGVVLERRWLPLETVGIYVPRNLVSTLVMCAVPAQAAGVERIVVCTPPAGAGLVAAAAELLGIDEVWALGGPQAIGWLAYVRKVDKIVGPGNAYVNEAKLAVQRDVAIDLPGRAVRGGRARNRRGRPAASSSSSSPRRASTAPTRSAGSSRRSTEAEAIAPGAPRAARRRRGARRAGAQRRRRLRRRLLAGRRGRLCDRRQPRPADRRLGAVARRARPRDVPEADHDPADHRRGLGAAAPDGRGARGGRRDDRARRGGAPMRPLAPEFRAYSWAPPSDEVARLAGIDPSQVVRFDQNTPPLPLPSTRPGTIAGALASINSYPSGGYAELRRAIAAYAGVEPENVVLGAGADDLILLCARAFAGPGDRVAIPDAPTYPLYRDRGPARGRRARRRGAGAHVRLPAEQPRRRRCAPLPEARPLVCDEAYFEFAARRRCRCIDEGVIVLRTFSKAFALAGARVGYALASREAAEELNARQAPAPVSSLSAALAIAALASPPDAAAADRGARAARRGASRARARAAAVAARTSSSSRSPTAARSARPCCARGSSCAPTTRGSGSRSATSGDDDLLVETLARLLDRPAPVAARPRAAARATCGRPPRRGSRVRLGLDGASRVSVQTGAGIYDHFLEQLAFHAGLDLVIEGAGDLETGDHHTVEDTALAFGEALDRALGDRRGIARYGDATVPMDDALARAAVDLGGRPFAELAIEPEPGLAGALLRKPRPGRAHGDPRRGRRAVTATTPPRRPTRRSAARSRTALRVESSGIPSTKGKL